MNCCIKAGENCVDNKVTSGIRLVEFKTNAKVFHNPSPGTCLLFSSLTFPESLEHSKSSAVRPSSSLPPRIPSAGASRQEADAAPGPSGGRAGRPLTTDANHPDETLKPARTHQGLLRDPCRPWQEN